MPLLDTHSSARALVPALLLVLVACLPLGAVFAGEGEETTDASAREAPVDPGAWSEEVLDLADHLPIQDGGRVKPFSTWASFTLLRISGRKTFKPEDGRRMGATAWALDTMFFPDQAGDYEVVLVEDRDALTDIGLEAVSRKKRDRYSFNELKAGIQTALEKAKTYERVDAKSRSSVENQVLNLARNLRAIAGLLRSMDYARVDLPVGRVSRRFEADVTLSFSEALSHWNEFLPDLKVLREATDQGVEPPEAAVETGRIAIGMRELAAGSSVLAVLPPTKSVKAEGEWSSVYNLTTWAPIEPAHVDLVRALEGLEATKRDTALFEAQLAQVLGQSRSLAKARGEYGKVETEVFFYRLDPFFWAKLLFLFAFVLVAVTWLKDARWIRRSALGLIGIAEVLLIWGIVLRCIIRGRPPVSTLYETVLFITAVGVIATLSTEFINRKRIALAATPILGAAGLFLASGYESITREDTMPSLVAVLDTNFWLATHVTTVTIGYCAGLLASALAHVYVFAKAFGLKRNDASYFTSLGRMVYGMVCFGLLFSTVGTILGGVWANDSWGRFWGWDPKENGALMIVLGNLVILHMRLGGYIKGFGISMLAIGVGMIVAFSWWGVNLLGVGLHSYGFTSGISMVLNIFYVVELAVLATGLFWYFVGRKAMGKKMDAAPPTGSA